MTMFRGTKVLRWCAALALATLAGMTTTTATAHDDSDEALLKDLMREQHMNGGKAPIIETHIHLYQPSRPGGVPWPPAINTTIYRDILPPEYKALAHANGILGAVVVEASPLNEDNQWVLDLIRGDRFFFAFSGQLEIGAPDFISNLNRFSMDPRFVGIRGFLWSPPAITLDAAQRRDLAELSRRGMTLDIITRGTTNPKPTVEALCTSFPKLRIVIDHLGGAQGAAPTPEWELSIRRLADLCPNLYMKFSSFYDMYQVGDGNSPWIAPLDLAAYKANFDVLFTAFGPDRMIWGGLGMNMAVFEKNKAMFEEMFAFASGEDRAKIRGRNAARLFHFKA